MPTILCPNCRVIRNMSVARYPKTIRRKRKVKKVLVETYRCEACGCFVGSEEIEEKDFETIKKEIEEALKKKEKVLCLSG